jgi:hypothetical protein
VLWAVIVSAPCTSLFTIIHLPSHYALLNLLLATDTKLPCLLIEVQNLLSTVNTQSLGVLLAALLRIIQNFTRTTVL